MLRERPLAERFKRQNRRSIDIALRSIGVEGDRLHDADSYRIQASIKLREALIVERNLVGQAIPELQILAIGLSLNLMDDNIRRLIGVPDEEQTASVTRIFLQGVCPSCQHAGYVLRIRQLHAAAGKHEPLLEDIRYRLSEWLCEPSHANFRGLMTVLDEVTYFVREGGYRRRPKRPEAPQVDVPILLALVPAPAAVKIWDVSDGPTRRAFCRTRSLGS